MVGAFRSCISTVSDFLKSEKLSLSLQQQEIRKHSVSDLTVYCAALDSQFLCHTRSGRDTISGNMPLKIVKPGFLDRTDAFEVKMNSFRVMHRPAFRLVRIFIQDSRSPIAL